MLKLNENNLSRLAAYLISLPDDYSHFNMESFLEKNNDSDDAILIRWGRFTEKAQCIYNNFNSCGTAACAIGHAPLVEGVDKPNMDEEWVEYSYRFIFSDYKSDFLLNEGANTIWNWLFSDDWTHIDNTPKGAGKRILLLLKDRKVANRFDQFTSGIYEDVYLELLETV